MKKLKTKLELVKLTLDISNVRRKNLVNVTQFVKPALKKENAQLVKILPKEN